MRLEIRNYLIKNTPKSLTPMPDGVLGEFSKIEEEYLELNDAIEQNNKMLTFIEACDLADACMEYNFNKFKVPSFLMLFIMLTRRLYKPFRNRLYTWCGLDKDYFNNTEGGNYELNK
tara:strand:- start:174 stop:524 length:351 start_codon:yes stop_codon:yes gene_type:complete